MVMVGNRMWKRDVQPELDAGEEQRFFHTAYYTGAVKTQEQKAAAFRALHERAGAFIIPNPWDAGTAKLLAALGFEALATTSLGRRRVPSGDATERISLRQVLDNCAVIAAATELPVSADLENCYARDPREAAQTIRLAAEAGVVGGSIEDSSGDERSPIYDFQLAVERVQAAAEMARSLGFPFVLTARAENFFLGRPDLDDTIRRLQAFEKAGADVLYAPGLRDLATIRTVALRSRGRSTWWSACWSPASPRRTWRRPASSASASAARSAVWRSRT